MTSRKTLFLLSVLACYLLSGCAAKAPIEHKTWVDLEKISKTVVQTKKDRASQQLEEEQKQAKAGAEKTPKTRDLSEHVEAGNSYLKGVKGEKRIPSGGGIEGEGVMLNFDNADIYEVIQVIGEALNLSYIIDPQVKGVVNIRSGKKIPKSELFVVFKKILNINGLDIRNEGDHYYIYVAAKPSSLAVYGKNQMAKLSPSAKMVTQVVPVVNILSAEAQKLITPYLSPQAVVYDLVDQNTLVISDYEGQIIDALSILSRLDVSALASMRIKVVRVEQAPLMDLRDELKEVLLALKVNQKDHEGVQLVPLERINSLMLIGFNDELVETAVKWVNELDRAPTGGRDSIYIYKVRNSVASELVDLVGSLITDKTSAKSESEKKKNTPSTTPGSLRPRDTMGDNKSKSASTSTTPKERTATGEPLASMQFAGAPTMIADDARNIVLIRAQFTDYLRVMKLLERLDNIPAQVLIEVLVAEVTLTDDLQYGVEWALMNQKNATYTNNQLHFGQPITNGGNVGLSTVTPSSTGTGTTGIIFDKAGDMFNLLNFLASNTHISVISSPQVLVLNNESATVNVGQQVPIVTSQLVGAEPTATTTVDNGLSTVANQSVQYKDTGVILNVTPRINAEGMVILEIDQQVSSVLQQTTGGINSPTISTKEVKTKLAVKDGQSILMGGMIAKDENKTDSGLPYLKNIPGLGWLFKQKSLNNTRTELLVMVTPYVIEDENVLNQYIKGFKTKVDGLRKDLQ